MIVWYTQELPTSCVAACVRMVLSDYGVQLPEKRVRQLLGHTPLGVSLLKACHRLRKAGATASVHSDWNLDDLRDALRQNVHPIVGIERHVQGHPPASHAVVLVELTSKVVKTLDPLGTPEAQTYGRASFELAWHLSGKEVLIIESPPAIE